MAETTHATAPAVNITVQAAAGTGKTWLLTSRIIRLLLEGTPPGAILAITFTRKAAAEIQQRISERLLQLAGADDDALNRSLSAIGVHVNAAYRQKARTLYEALLTAVHPLRVATFHAFCQEILQRFPLESGLPPGFQVIESTAELEAAAWRAFERELNKDPQSPTARAMDDLLHATGGATALFPALNAFLSHRSDWWAFTEDQQDPLAFAITQVRKTLAIDEDYEPRQAIAVDAELVAMLHRYMALLDKHPIKTNRERVNHIAIALTTDTAPADALEQLLAAFMTNAGTLRILKSSKTLELKLGTTGAEELLRLHHTIGALLEALREQNQRYDNFQQTRAWYACGQRLLSHFQQLKTDRQVLDFADLEWQTYRLLNRSRHAEWVQYKLDQRIDQLLVDEFQDTNPTQWRLLLPLLEEMAAGKSERNRGVFLVGDVKQSIYRFRRAEPALFAKAHAWLKDRMQARTVDQHQSQRSSPAIIEFVNLVFNRQQDRDNIADPPADDHYHLPDFAIHETRHEQLWGQVEVLPLIRWQQNGDKTIQAELRNPLQQPRLIKEDERYRAEADCICKKILASVGRPIADGDTIRALDYGDIMILVRSRTNVAAYEDALRRSGIPYVGAGRSSFIESLEVGDLLHLLQALLAPYDNLALASTLRSPIFSCTDVDLMELAARDEPWWWQRLQQLGPTKAAGYPLHRAQRLLSRWQRSIDRIPVHDLLDRIYAETNLVGRYLSCAPRHLRSRVQGNLNRLLELALEMDSGRYPSLAHFVNNLQQTGHEVDETAPAPLDADRGRVRIMTIHGAKGLEAPAVFLADAARGIAHSTRGFHALVDWPVDSTRPEHFLLVGKKADRDNKTAALVAAEEKAARQEEANLLYVALTRARQILYISGCEAGRGGRGWYGFIEKRLQAARASLPSKVAQLAIDITDIGETEESPNTVCTIEYGRRPETVTKEKTLPIEALEIDPALGKPLPEITPVTILNPSDLEAVMPREIGASEDTAARQRGILMHRMLELLTTNADRPALRNRLWNEFSDVVSTDQFEGYWREAQAVVDHRDLRPLFDPSAFDWARNEMPILYRENEQTVYGIIDRLVCYNGEIVVLDYKTHAQAKADTVDALAEPYFAQLRYYGMGVKKLWPDKTVRLKLLFTACQALAEVPFRSQTN